MYQVKADSLSEVQSGGTHISTTVKTNLYSWSLSSVSSGNNYNNSGDTSTPEQLVCSVVVVSFFGVSATLR